MKIHLSQSKTRVVFAATLMVVVPAVVVWFATRPERKEVVGKVDPVSGYRYRFTLSAAWNGEYRPLNMVDPNTGWKAGLDYYVCTLRPSPVSQWMNSHLLHLPSESAPEIRLTTYTKGDLPVFNFLHRFVDGYPEPVLETQARMVTHRHLKIDGYPATVVAVENAKAGMGYAGTELLVDVSNHTLVYDLRGFEGSSPTEVNEEMQAILSSFHLEKVATPLDGKSVPPLHTS